MKNSYSQVIPVEVLDKVVASLDEVSKALKPYCTELSTSQREELPKLGVRNTGKMVSIASEMNMAPEYAPPAFQVDEVNKDVKVVQVLTPVFTKVLGLQKMLDDTLCIAGSEAFEGCMDYYCSVKRQASRRDPKAQAIFDRLGPMFARPNKKKKEAKPGDANTDKDKTK